MDIKYEKKREKNHIITSERVWLHYYNKYKGCSWLEEFLSQQVMNSADHFSQYIYIYLTTSVRPKFGIGYGTGRKYWYWYRYQSRNFFSKSRPFFPTSWWDTSFYKLENKPIIYIYSATSGQHTRLLRLLFGFYIVTSLGFAITLQLYTK